MSMLMNPFGFFLRWLDRRIDDRIAALKRHDAAAFASRQPERMARGREHVEAMTRDGIAPSPRPEPTLKEAVDLVFSPPEGFSASLRGAAV